MHSTSPHQRVPISALASPISVCPLHPFPQTLPVASVKIHPSIIGTKDLPRNSVPLRQLSVLPSPFRFGDIPVYYVVLHVCGSAASILSQLGSALHTAPRVGCYVLVMREPNARYPDYVHHPPSM